MSTFYLTSPKVRENAWHAIANAPAGSVVKINPAKRSNAQNALLHAWYGQIADALPEDDAMGWKCYCKLHHGVPILRAEDEEFRETYDAAIKGLRYEQKLHVMRILPVTSLMNKDQLSKYAAQVKADFDSRNVILESQL